MAAPKYHTGTSRGVIGVEFAPNGPGTNTGVIPTVTIADSNGVVIDSFGSGVLPAGSDRSGTNAANAFDIAAANSSRRLLDFQNTSDTEMRVSEFTANPASATYGFKVAPNAGFRTTTNQKITGYCAATGKTYQATEV